MRLVVVLLMLVALALAGCTKAVTRRLERNADGGVDAGIGDAGR